ncbi:MAG: ParA family protein [Firmicutes bacterium]|nr:ParA family protein [Bacillota bacterium]MBQ6841692.1 ParA family protein [Bacillota bacterium]MBR6823756.1 ParA family protein [Bacillota bacterium]
MTKTVAIVNQKGGVAKTTTTINLGACLAKLGKRVLLVDCDPQGNAGSGLGVQRRDLQYCVYDLLINDAPAEAVLRHTATENLDIMPATIRLAGAEAELVTAISREVKLRRALKSVADRYDYILIDCPPSLGMLTVNALVAADSLLIPLQCEFYALEGVSQLLSTYELVKKNINSALFIEGVLLTMYDGRTNLSVEVAAEARKYFDNKVYQAVIPRSVRLSEAPSHGLPIIEYDPRSKGAEQYMLLAQEFLAHNGGAR